MSTAAVPTTDYLRVKTYKDSTRRGFLFYYEKYT